MRRSNDHRALGRYRQNHQRPARASHAERWWRRRRAPPFRLGWLGRALAAPARRTKRPVLPTTPPRRRHVGERGRLCAESWAPGALPLVAGGSARLCITRRPPRPRSGPAYGRFGTVCRAVALGARRCGGERGRRARHSTKRGGHSAPTRTAARRDPGPRTRRAAGRRTKRPAQPAQPGEHS